MVFNVKGQSLELDGGNVIAEGAVEFASFTLECDSSWDSFSKTVRFRHVSQEETYDVAGVVDGRVYYIPAEVLVRGSVFVSVLGVNGTNRISTTELAGFFVEGTVDSGKTPSVTENAYAQYVDMVRGKCEEVEESAVTAKSFRDEAEAFASDASVSEEKARSSAGACMDYASFCQKVSSDVSGAEVSMNKALEGVRDSVEALLSHDHSLSVAENERAASENVRGENERLRKSAESERVYAENMRVDAENERIAAERGRVAGENERNARLSETENKVKSIADSLFMTAGVIKGKMQSGNIVIDDAAERSPIKFGIVGKSVQTDIPSRSNPVSINSASPNGSIKIIHRGKNLIEHPYVFSNAKYVNGITIEPLDDGGILVSGRTLPEKKATVAITFSDYALTEGCYVVSGGVAGCGVYVYDKAKGEYIARSRGGDSEFTVKAEGEFEVRLYVYADTLIDDNIVYPMIRYSGTDDTYRKWEEKVYNVDLSCPLHSVKGISDCVKLVDCEKGAVLEKYIVKYVADGTENVNLTETIGEYNVFSVTKNDGIIAKKYDKYADRGFCNYLPYCCIDDSECCWVFENEIMLKLNVSEFPDSSSVTAFLSKCYADGVPFETVYVLKTPEIRDYSWNDSITLMKDVNVLTADSGDISLEYIKDTNTVYESIIDTLISLDARVSLLEV